MKMKSNGIVYLAVGYDALNQAYLSANSINKQVTNISERDNITIFSDVINNQNINAASNIQTIDIRSKLDKYQQLPGLSKIGYLKTQLNELSPYDRTLYLDNDTRAVADYRDIWKHTDSFCAAKAWNPVKNTPSHLFKGENHYTAQLMSENSKQFNTGMYLFDKNKSNHKLFNHWFSEWTRFMGHENMAFSRMLLDGDYLITEISSIYNDYYPDWNTNSKIIHFISHYKKYL